MKRHREYGAHRPAVIRPSSQRRAIGAVILPSHETWNICHFSTYMTTGFTIEYNIVAISTPCGTGEAMKEKIGDIFHLYAQRHRLRARTAPQEPATGQTVPEKMDLHVDCRERRPLPNPAHPDQPVLKVDRGPFARAQDQ